MATVVNEPVGNDELTQISYDVSLQPEVTLLRRECKSILGVLITVGAMHYALRGCALILSGMIYT